MTTRDPLAALRKKLEAAELEHLRRHVQELQERLEAAEDRAARAEDWAHSAEAIGDMWRMQAESLIDGTRATIGITMDGTIGLMQEAA